MKTVTKKDRPPNIQYKQRIGKRNRSDKKRKNDKINKINNGGLNNIQENKN